MGSLSAGSAVSRHEGAGRKLPIFGLIGGLGRADVDKVAEFYND
jgi:hypothetical protein